MKLSIEGIKDKKLWQKARVRLPEYDIERVRRNTLENPKWVHFGGGNIFKAYIASLLDDLLDEGEEETGVIVAGRLDKKTYESMYAPFDNLVLAVTLSVSGESKKRVIGSIARVLLTEEYEELVSYFTKKSLQMTSFTITEKGYALKDAKGEYFPSVKECLESGAGNSEHGICLLDSLLYERFKAGGYPISCVSMDNCSHNGEKLRNAALEIAEIWVKNGKAEKEFLDYIRDEKRVAFPWSMIDKITPRPSPEVGEALKRDGIEDMAGIVASGVYIAPFVNAEEAEYLVIEDAFPNGRPPLEKAGVYFTDRDTVNKVERMKVTTCLNPLHTAMAVYGCVLGYKSIAEEMKDKEIVALIKRIGYEEGLPVVTNPGIIDPKAFIDEVFQKRLPNPFIPDTPQRIATDTSQKIAIRYGETIKAYLSDKSMDVKTLTGIPLALAGYLRYAMGIDDEGKVFALSDDPMKEKLSEILKGVKIGEEKSAEGILSAFLENETIFGVDLCKAGLAEKVEGYFKRLIRFEGAVRLTLREELTEVK